MITKQEELWIGVPRRMQFGRGALSVTVRGLVWPPDCRWPEVYRDNRFGSAVQAPSSVAGKAVRPQTSGVGVY